ncbi:hypothetical protein Naga_100158g18 [Nannochloropsis gaditana]|uniref:Uncharacterized protein n=1 Tax=Nannochloropsis gaditana TaxID=72520 RepID=W7TRV6_9STRA|nr:hypothetical protein Naga_100158g18 [Nannochloropsis gaditana]
MSASFLEKSDDSHIADSRCERIVLWHRSLSVRDHTASLQSSLIFFEETRYAARFYDCPQLCQAFLEVLAQLWCQDGVKPRGTTPVIWSIALPNSV